MNIWIHTEAITFSKLTYLPKGLVYFCSSLQKDGFGFSCDHSLLTKKQKTQLEVEELFAHFSITESDGRIELNASENKLQFWVNTCMLADGHDFDELFSCYLNGLKRTSEINRTTNETDISIELNLDGIGKNEISTGLKFFDHMLEQIAKHGLIDLALTCKGDLEVDEHHTIEDVAIALGDTILKALGDKKGIERYAFVLPMDESQATVALDLSGRPYLTFEGDFKREYVGDMPTEMVKHFFYSLAMHLKATLHIEVKGDNDHHKIEAIFKGFARVLKTAVEKNPRIKHMIPSSKGSL